MDQEFKKAHHTICLSDFHLSDAEGPRPSNPYWKAFKRSEHFVDASFKEFLEEIPKKCEGPIELIFNGDVFDFDTVLVLPKKPSFKVNWLETKRGLNSSQPKSVFKLSVILDHHPIFIQALRNFILQNHRVIFIIGNHDCEMHWPACQHLLLEKLDLPIDYLGNIRFCEWFYISNKDTLIEHGNQYDAYSMCINPIHPFIRKLGEYRVRVPFADLANKYMTGGMGYINPHSEANYILSFTGYVKFFFKYYLLKEPLVLWTWFWGASITLFRSLYEGFLPAVIDPLTLEDRIESIAYRANAKKRMVRGLRALHAHPAILNPLKIFKELWLDRAFFFLGIILLTLEFFALLNHFSFWWTLIPVILLTPIFIYYARSVKSEIYKQQSSVYKKAPLSTRLADVRRLVVGHTHLEGHFFQDQIEILNTGNWSPAFHDVECTKPYGKKCFVWIHPVSYSSERKAELIEWKDKMFNPIPPTQTRQRKRRFIRLITRVTK